jgi:large subunit ribosomal protein L4
MNSVTLTTLNFSNSETGSKKVDVAANLDIESAKSVAYVVRWQLASRRSGSAKVKDMSEISGTTAKPWKQKGTGRARQGSRRSVQFVGGRTCHGPTPRSFDFSMPKKIVKIALSDAVKFKLTEQKFVLFSDFGSEIKTAKLNSTLSKNNFVRTLIIHDGSSPALVQSARNLKNVKTLRGDALNVYDLLSFDHILVDDKIFESKILGAAL